MLKKIILASSIALAMMACSSKGSYTCECKPESIGSDGKLRYREIETTIMTEVPKSLAEEECAQIESSSTSTEKRTTVTNRNGVISTNETTDVSTNTYKTKCTLTEK